MAAGLFQSAPDQIDFKATHLVVEVYSSSNVRDDRAATITVCVQDGLWIADFRTQAFLCDFVAGRDDNGALNRILQFAHVAGPRIPFEQRQYFRSKTLRYLASVLFVVLAHEMLGQRQDVFAAI